MRAACLSLLAALALLQGCATTAPPAACSSVAPNASYTGPYKGEENRLSAADMARDLQCAEAFKAQKYPRGFVVVYGSSRLGEDKAGAAPTDSGRLYQGVRGFAAAWTRAHGASHPIMTGAGPGMMEAAARGATEAGGPSIGYTTYYGPARDKADARLAFQTWQGQPIVSDGLVFTSVAMRESMMVLHAAAVVVTPGGTGTEWEIFQTLESIKSRQLDPVPIYLVGPRALYWKGFEQRVQEMARLGTIRSAEVTDLIRFAEDPQTLVEALARDLKLAR
ncbi:LOG family protein [Pseudorhodoferax sp.]|uniref:LOG family protein n=1 Tax=Pseudorhodoferax sp. TaxID=1993553 RepID=UPI002DD67625|nr:LOG family protein [Pseudorhodoferax sp.]